MVIFMPGAWMVHRIEYVPFFVSFLEKEPLTWVLEPNLAGPLTTLTLCGALPFQTHLTVVPLLTVIFLATKTLSLTWTVLVAASAGMASAPAATVAAAPAA